VTTVKLKHIDRFRDRHGLVRYYFRRGQGPRTPLRGRPSTPEFLDSYHQALAANSKSNGRAGSLGAPGTFDRLLKEYFQSPEFLRLSAGSQRHYRYIIERWIGQEAIGHRLVEEMTRDHISKMLAKRASKLGTAHGLLQKIRILMHFAIDRGWRSEDPTLRLKAFRLGTIHTWTDAEIQSYENAWPIGTLERTAFALFLYTGQRVSDVARMSWLDLEKSEEDTGQAIYTGPPCLVCRAQRLAQEAVNNTDPEVRCGFLCPWPQSLDGGPD